MLPQKISWATTGARDVHFSLWIINFDFKAWEKKNNDLHLQLLYYIKKLHFKYEQVGTLIHYLIR